MKAISAAVIPEAAGARRDVSQPARMLTAAKGRNQRPRIRSFRRKTLMPMVISYDMARVALVDEASCPFPS